jgi:formaldehyde-activating enzyme involved in methanogenesis
VIEEKIDFKILFETHRAATAKAIHKAMNHEPGIDWLLKNQDKVTHCFHQMALDGNV